jgi:hypothetical protein
VALLALIALIGVALFASLSLDEGDTDPIEIDGAGDVRKLVGGIPQLEDRLGEDNAPVKIEVFNDLQCTDCADWQVDVIETLIADEVRGGDVKLEFRPRRGSGSRRSSPRTWPATSRGATCPRATRCRGSHRICASARSRRAPSRQRSASRRRAIRRWSPRPAS